jgi:hypothetical protein
MLEHRFGVLRKIHTDDDREARQLGHDRGHVRISCPTDPAPRFRGPG